MKILGIRHLTLSFIVLNLVFFSFIHGLFTLQLFKHTVNAELMDKLQMETLLMKNEYLGIQEEAAQARVRILEGSRVRSRLIVEQVCGVIQAIVSQQGSLGQEELRRALKETLEDYNTSSEQCFWIFDDQGFLVLGPRENLTDIDLPYGRALVDAVRSTSNGTVSLPRQGRAADNPGYGKRIASLGWTVVSFRPWDVLERKLLGFETLRKLRTDRLINQMSQGGSAGVVDRDLHLVEYTYTQQKGHHVDEIRLEGPKQASEALFNGEDGIREYVIQDPVSHRAKYRQAYMHYDVKTRSFFFISRNKQEIFNGIDHRASPALSYLGGLSLLLLIVNTVFVIRELLRRKSPEEEALER